VQFNLDRGGSPEHYAGHIVDAVMILVSPRKASRFAELLPRRMICRMAPLRAHIGPQATGAAPGHSVGTKTLVGRSHRSFVLEPLSVTGVNLAFGIAGFRLRSAH
jgi:hypothetical protein